MMTPKEIYLLCLSLARASPCQKLGFGAVIMEDDMSIPRAQTFNGTIGPLAYLCPEGECVRLKIQSRTQSMIGACCHAEERALFSALTNGRTEMSKSDLYVQGVQFPSMNPLVKIDPTFTCIRCATQMLFSGIRGINVWFEEEWNFIPTEKALEQASHYAIGILEVNSK